MRILSVTHFYERHGGGIEIVAGQLARQLDELGHESVWAASAADQPPTDTKIKPLPLNAVDLLEKLTGLPMPVPMPVSAAKLWRAVGRSDGVIVHDALYVTSIIATLAARWYGKPIILIQHIGSIPFANRFLKGLMHIANRLVTRPIMRAVDQTVFISHTVRAQFSSLNYQREPQILFNGINAHRHHLPSRDETIAAKRQFGFSTDRPTLLFVGRFVEKKGMAIVREIATALPGHDFVLAGAGPINPDDWKLQNVRVVGSLQPDDLAVVYRGADALLLPSTGEGYPLVIQEALANGLPVFCGEESARADPGASDIIRGHPVDLAAPKASADAFVKAIQQHRLGRSADASRYAIANYNWQRNAVALVNMLGHHQAARALQSAQPHRGSMQQRTHR